MNEKQFDFPTEVISLPSDGKVYPLDNPLSSGQITLKCMTAKEEDILSSQNLIKRGVVLDKLFESIIMDDININDIVIGDKNAIILSTRLLGYGAEYPMKFYSVITGETHETIVNLANIKIKDVDLTLFNNKNEFQFETPYGKDKLTFKLLTHGDEIAIEKDIQALEKLNKDNASDITTRLRYMITAVNGNSDMGAIGKFINGFQARDSKAFRTYVKSISPDVDMNIEYVHEDGEKEVVPITMGVGFFWPSDKS
jgi:hypothetical protein